MSKFIVKPLGEPREDGAVLSITPDSAGWTFVGFEVLRLREGEKTARLTENREVCLVLLSGRASIRTRHAEWINIGKRMNVFEKTPPFSVYVPNEDIYEIKAMTDAEIAVCSAPGKGTHPARLISQDEVGVETRGQGNVERLIHNILPEGKDADSLLVVEVFTPEGHWSSYPPHKHDRDALPDESLLEETYYFRVQPEQGFAVQRVYTDDRSIDETMAITDGQAVLVPKGYHPVSAPPGYEVYYLNVMAGPRRIWKFHNDPDHAWQMKQ